MGRVVVGREYSGEALAGAAPDTAQKARCAILARPIPQYRNPAAIGQRDSGDVNGIAGCMFAPAATHASPDPPAALRAEMFDAGYR